MSFTVASWNLQWRFGDWEIRQPVIDSVLEHLGADVITLQETWPEQTEAIADRLGFHHVWGGHRPATGDGHTSSKGPQPAMGNAIVSRWPIDHDDLRFLEDARGHRYRTIVHARLRSPHGAIPMFTTHLDHRFDRSSVRCAQLEVASTFIEHHAAGDLPPILAGDLNAVPDSDELRRLTGRSVPFVEGRIWTDAWELVGRGPGITWSSANPYINHSAWPNRRLDYVLIGWPRPQRPVGNPRRAWLFGTEAIDGVVASDHYGVAVEIRAEPGKMEP